MDASTSIATEAALIHTCASLVLEKDGALWLCGEHIYLDQVEHEHARVIRAASQIMWLC